MMSHSHLTPRDLDGISHLAHGRLAGRDDALDSARQTLCLTSAGRSSLLVVSGAGGSGKTALLQQIADEVDRSADGTCLRARCSPLEEDLPLGVAQQLFTERGFTVVGPQESRGVFDALYERVGELTATRRLILMVDDLHWADRRSVEFLGYLVRRLNNLPVAVILAYDPHEPVPDDRIFALTDLVHDASAAELVLGELDHDAVASLCRAELGTDDGDLVAACLRLTAGKPFLLAALLDAVRGDSERGGEAPAVSLLEAAERCVPPLPATMTVARIEHHGPYVVRVLRQLSVLTTPVTAEQAAVILDQDVVRTEEALALLRQLGLIPADDGIMITPELLRRSLHAGLGPAQTHEVAARAAAVFSQHQATHYAAALQLVQARPAGDEHNIAILRWAASMARANGEPSAAAAFLRRALAEPPSRDASSAILADLGTAELAFDGPNAAQHLRAALAAQTSDTGRACCALKLAYALAVDNQPAAGIGVLEEELRHSGLAAGHDLIASMRVEAWFLSLGDDEARRRLRDGIEPLGVASGPQALTSQVHRRALAACALSHAFACHPAVEVVQQVRIALAGEITPSPDAAIAMLTTGMVLLWGDELRLADRFFADAAAAARAAGTVLSESVATSLRSLVAVRRGDLAAAREQVRAAADLIESPGWSSWRMIPLIGAVRLAIELDMPADALRGLADNGLSGDLPQCWLADVLLGYRGQLKLLNGDPAAALTDMLEAGRRLTAIGCLNPAICAWRSSAAIALARLGETGEAIRLADQEVSLAAAWGAPRAHALALCRRGGLRPGAEGLADITMAVELLRPVGQPLQLARTLLDQGRHCRRARHYKEARAALTESYDIAYSNEAPHLADNARDELIGVGGRPRVRRHANPMALTESELRIAQMAVAGYTNEEIAHRIYVARRTVEAHLTSTYQKLQIRGRSQLQSALSRAIPDDPAAERGHGQEHARGSSW